MNKRKEGKRGEGERRVEISREKKERVEGYLREVERNKIGAEKIQVLKGKGKGRRFRHDF